MTDQEIIIPTLRELVVQTLLADEVLRALGLPEGGVFQADSMENPEFFPFIVVRWLDEQAGIGRMTRRPFDLWCYDGAGDNTRADRIGRRSLLVLGDLEPTAVEGGWLTKIEMSRAGLGRGSDLYDDGYKAVVVPYRAMAVASGT
jgi:hypothetical protein